MISRRNFIQAIGIASAAGIVFNLCDTALGQTLKSDGLFQIPDEILSDPLLTFTSGHFIPFINTDFEIRAENSKDAERLRLLNVKELSANTKNSTGGDSFSLMFFNPGEEQLKETSYEFSHFALGTFMLTISPVSAEPNRYEAVINHLRR